MAPRAPATFSSCPRADQAAACNRAQQNRFSSPNLSAKISQHGSENSSCYIVNFTEDKNCSRHRIYVSSLPRPPEGGLARPCSPAVKAKAEGGKNPNAVQSHLPPGVSAELCPLRAKLCAGCLTHITLWFIPFLKGPLVSSFCNQRNLGPNVRKLVQGLKAPATYVDPWSPN